MLWFAHGSASRQCRAADGRPRLDGVIGWSRIRAVAGSTADGRPISRFPPLEPGPDPRSGGAAIPGGASGLLVRDSKSEADRMATSHRPGVVSLIAELRCYERQASEEAGQWKTGVE